jgi:hypothetical protein
LYTKANDKAKKGDRSPQRLTKEMMKNLSKRTY